MILQSFAGLDPTGELDGETVEKMNTPRCGVRDMVGPSTNARRRKRYALQVNYYKNGQFISVLNTSDNINLIIMFFDY